LTDAVNALLTAAASGDESAFQTLCEQYAPLIQSMSERVISSFSKTADTAAISVQDLEQEARLALYRAAMRYDASGGAVTFGLYAKICIRNSLISLLRKSASAARAARGNNREIRSHSDSDPLVAFVSASEAKALTARIHEVLSPYEIRVFDLYISGRSVKSISDSVGKPEKSVSNALFRIRAKIKGLLAN